MTPRGRQSRSVPRRPRPVAIILRWGRAHKLRAALYTLALLPALAPAWNTYHDYTSWLAAPFGAAATPAPSGAYSWFGQTDTSLYLLADAPGPDALGLEFATSNARVHPPGEPVAFSAMRLFLADAKHADPADKPPPDPDRLAPMLAELWWPDRPLTYTITSPAPGVYDLRYENTAATRRFTRRMAAAKLPIPLLILGACIAAGETLAFAARRIRTPGPGDCPSCGYPIADLPAPVCPECGTPAPAAPRS